MYGQGKARPARAAGRARKSFRASETGDDSYPHRPGGARRDVVIAVGGGKVLPIEQVLDIYLKPQVAADPIVCRRVEPGIARQGHAVVYGGVDVVLIDHTQADPQCRRRLVSIPERGRVLWDQRNPGSRR